MFEIGKQKRKKHKMAESIADDSVIETTTGGGNRRGPGEIIYLSSNEDDDPTEQGEQENDEDVMETEEDDDEAEYLKSRSKQPRLDPSATATEDAKKQAEEAPVEEEVGTVQVCFGLWEDEMLIFVFWPALLDMSGTLDQLGWSSFGLAQVRPFIRRDLHRTLDQGQSQMPSMQSAVQAS